MIGSEARRGRGLLLAAVLSALAGSGCSWASARARDFGDIWRLEVQAGYGLQAHANAGELLHAGVGMSRHWSAGLLYGEATTQSVIEDHPPATLVRTLLYPKREHLHRLQIDPDGKEELVHRGVWIFPGQIEGGTIEKHDIHALDLEAGFVAGVVGIEAGFSVGELLDFVLGIFRWTDDWTVMDPGEDDGPELRGQKTFWRRRRTHEGIVLPD